MQTKKLWLPFKTQWQVWLLIKEDQMMKKIHFFVIMFQGYTPVTSKKKSPKESFALNVA